MSIKRKLEYLAKTKQEIRKAIVSRKVDVTQEDTFRSYADKIRNISVHDPYEGPYNVGPSLETIVLPTFDKSMTNDVTVEVYPEFEGSYIITPSTTEQIIQSKNKVLTDDMVVPAITAYDGSFLYEIASIGFETMPTKMLYSDNEAITLDGAVVRAYYDDGKPWEGNEDYPGGIIPLNELALSQIKTDYSKRSERLYASKDRNVIAKIVTCNETGPSWWVGQPYNYGGDLGLNVSAGTTGMCSCGTTGVTFFITQYNGRLYAGYEAPVGSSNQQFTFGGEIGGEWRLRISGSWTREYCPPMKFVASDSANNQKYMETYDFSKLTVSEADPTEYTEDDFEYIGGTNTITVSWERPGDGETVETDLEVRVEKIFG